MQLLEFSWYPTCVDMPKQVTILNIYRLKNPLGNCECEISQDANRHILEEPSKELAFLGVYTTS